MNFDKVFEVLSKQGRKKSWLINQLNSYPMEFHRVVKNDKDIPIEWYNKIPNILGVQKEKLK